MRDYIRFDSERQNQFKEKLRNLLEEYDITIEAIDAREYGIESIDFCDRCGVGVTTELSEISCHDIASLTPVGSSSSS